MNALTQLADRLRQAAASPPKIIADKVKDRSVQIISTTITDSRGQRRPIVRQTLAQQKALEDRASGRAIDAARESLIEQAKEIIL